MRFLVVVICCVFMISCGSDDNGDDPVICTTQAFPGFEIQITNASTGTALSGVTITAREGNTFEEVLEETATLGTYQGVFEREGSYVLVIALTGFQTIITESITVGRLEDVCTTLDTQELSFSLTEL
ncbi:hypothetical protein [Dokdonia sp.]|uniref:hypothetical protein n=1 Tax=Dokdonia sp. TaxID=2024995 RepID=UPI003264192C